MFFGYIDLGHMIVGFCEHIVISALTDTNFQHFFARELFECSNVGYLRVGAIAVSQSNLKILPSAKVYGAVNIPLCKLAIRPLIIF